MENIQELKDIVKRLRGPDGCPWDKEQTHHSICDCLIEEVSELLDTIDRMDMGHMKEELGDILLHVVFHAQMAEELGHFRLEDVIDGINEKLIRRHPHVFGNEKAFDTETVLKNWEKIKAQEKGKESEGRKSLFKEQPPKLPALLYARETHKYLLKNSINTDALLDREAISILKDGISEKTAGKMLYEIAAACHEVGIDPESTLRRYTSNFISEVDSSELVHKCSG